MTAGVEGLPTGARDRLAEALCGAGHVWTGEHGPYWFVDVLLPAVAELVNEARADERDLRQRVTALADDFDRLFRTAGQDEKPGSATRGFAMSTGIGYRRASLRLRDVLAGYEGSLYYGALPWLRDQQQQPTCQQPHSEGDTTWKCLQPAGHDGHRQHEDSAGHRW